MTNINYENGKAKFTITYNGIDFTGVAQCHPEDLDYGNERTGLCIAEARATIKVKQFKRDYELKPQLKILYHVYHNLQRGKYYNEKSYETRMIQSQIRSLEKQLTAMNNDIDEEKKSLKEYIDGKEKLYQRLRAKNQQSSN